MPTILILESSVEWQTIYRKQLGELRAVFAGTIQEAESMLQKNDPFDCIVVCGRLQTSLDAVPFVKKIRTTFKGPIVAASNFSTNREELTKAGCTHEVPDNKWDTMKVVRQALGITE